MIRPNQCYFIALLVVALLTSRNAAFHVSGSPNSRNGNLGPDRMLTTCRTRREHPWTVPLRRYMSQQPTGGSEMLEKRMREDEKKENDNSGDGSDDDDELTIKEHSLDWETIVRQAKLFKEMAIPFFEESKSGRLLFFFVLGLTLLNSGVSVVFSYLGKDFWNALSSKNVDEFYGVLYRYVPALVVGAPIVTYYRFQREQLSLAWRKWMTDRTLELYSSDRVYYALERGKEIDNPDQRIAEDVRAFTTYSLTLFITILRSIIDFGSFSLILWSIYPQLFGAVIGYAIFGTITTSWLGQSLVGLNFKQLQKEADFRYSLVRLRENAESIAFYSGEALEGKAIRDRFGKVANNTRDVNVAQRNLEFFTTGYAYIIQILPVSVVAPKYFAGSLQLGQVSQSVGAFNHILNDLSIIINQFESLSSFSAGIDRLSQFYKAIRRADPERDGTGPLLKPVTQKLEEGGEEERLNSPSVEVSEVSIRSSVAAEQESNGSSVEVVQESMAMANKVNGKEEFGTIQVNFMEANGYYSNSTITTTHSQAVLTLQNLDLCTPDRKRTLIRDLTFSLKEGTNLLIVGNSGAGKSSLLRGIAGLWTAGNGLILRPHNSDIYFLPQRPYCTLGSLKDQLLYPSLDEVDSKNDAMKSTSHIVKQKLTDDDLLRILEKVDLSELAGRAGDGDPYKGLRTELDWSNTLSLGEQQRLAFGRVLVNQPRLVVLDEATSALDMVSEAKMYQLLQNMAQKTLTMGGQLSPPGLTYISVGHRPSLLAFHDKRLRLGGEQDHELTDIEKSSLNIPSSVSNL